MAQTIPETIPSKASQGEKVLFAALKSQLPDSFIVWYEPTVDRLLPDFVVLGPSFGLLILEVKGWFASSIERASHDFFEIRYQRAGKTRVESNANPLKQGHNYFGPIADQMKQRPLLCQPNGNYRGKLCFPIGVGAVMSNITAQQSVETALYPVLEQPAVAYRDELLQWPSFSSDDLAARLKEMFKTDFSFPALTADQVNTIKGLIHPTTAIEEVPVVASSLPAAVTYTLPEDATRLLSLDIEQERLARTMQSGHRLVSGVAGSGKTLILLARAKALANRLDTQKVLILCFNIALAAHLRSLLHSDTRNPQYRQSIEVLNFHSWAKSVLGRLPSPKQVEPDAYDQLLGEQLLSHLQQRPEQQRWDAVLVDEAHTFDQSWFPCCVAALKNSEDGDLLIVSDRNQGLYRRREFSWQSVGIKARGRSKRLTQNYRNTQEILSAAWDVLRPSQGKADAAFPTVEPSAALRRGTAPVLHMTASKTEAASRLVAQVEQFCNQGYAPADVAIVYKYKGRQEQAAFQTLMQQLDQRQMMPYWVTASAEGKRRYDSQRPGVRIVTALSALGLEFKLVLLLWVEQFWNCHHADAQQAERDRRQLYVAMTRAQDELHLFSGGNARIVQELRDSQNFRVR